MRVRANIPKGEYGFLRRGDGAWVIHTPTAETPALEPAEQFSALGRDEYRLLGLGDGTARVIRFSDLHRHSTSSIQDSIIKIPDLVEATEYSGALTDHGNMCGFLEFYKAMKQAGKKPIIGIEGYMEDMNGNLARRHVILLAKNDTGYRNLSKLTSESQFHFHHVPHITWDMLLTYHDGIICLSACLAGVIPTAIKEGAMEVAEKAVQRFQGIFGEDFYVEIQNHGIPEEDMVRDQLCALARKHGVKVVATTDSHYTHNTAEDKEAHQAILCLRTETTMDAPGMVYPGEGYYLHTSEDMEKRFAAYPEALDNTLEIAEKCDVEIQLGEVNLPRYEIPAEFQTPYDYLCHISNEGFQARFSGTPHLTDQVYLDRLAYEQDMIKRMGFSSYFVIVWDLLNWAKNHDIYVGPGRGSAAGSMVAYCMGITDVDPIRYGLLFERFLNPERVSCPDIDTDIEHTGRGQVLQYVRRKYGAENVCRIIAPGTFAAKRALLDMAKVYGMTASQGARLAKLVPPGVGVTLAQATEPGTPLADLMSRDPSVQRVVRSARIIEGCKRHNSVHPCGVCIAPSIVSDYIPVTMILDRDSGERVLCTQVTKDEVEELGLIKMDLLGLKNLSAVHETITKAQANRGVAQVLAEIKSPRTDIVRYQDITMADRQTYEMLRAGRTGGVFQLESKQITSLVQTLLSDLDDIPDDRLEAVAFERLVAAVALYRPGPMDYIPDYIKGIQSPANVRYDCEAEAAILSSTYGVLVYQEQLIQLCQKLAGYTLGEADVVRKACAKKKASLLLEERRKFILGNEADYKAGKTKHLIPGCVNNGISGRTAETIWAKMEKFGAYAFNRSHAVCYAYISYLTAYMARHWPGEFFAAMLNAYITDADKGKALLRYAYRQGLTLSAPDVQRSDCWYTGHDHDILFGLYGIAGVKKTAESIVRERAANGPFANLADLYDRLAANGVPLDKTALEGLVYSGALSGFSTNKSALIAQYSYVKGDYQDRAAGQTSLFETDGDAAPPLPTNVTPLSEQTAMRREVEALGVYVSTHPVDRYEQTVKDRVDYTPLDQVESMTTETAQVKTLGLIQNVQVFFTKAKGQMATFSLETRGSAVPCVVFPSQYKGLQDVIVDNAVLCVEGGWARDTRNEDAFQLIVRKAQDPDKALHLANGHIIAEVHNYGEQKMILDYIKTHPGDMSVTLKGHDRYFNLTRRVADTPETRAFFQPFICTS